jgi:phosphoribosylglycinamide formyltransferase-1/phosphoribosylamine--glycine ligase/phosphoribosylglycinamide formyltransferase/phosphoribosylformylglycinamidine cyclo-ligase
METVLRSPKTKVGILISGRGSNMRSLIEAAGRSDHPYGVAVVLSDVPDAGGLETARGYGVQALAIDRKPFGKDREAHERALHQALVDHGVEVVALAGYMRVLTPFLVDAWRGRMLNIHPSLLPSFPGLQTHARALASGVKLHGCTVHLVDEDVDHGPILGQAAVPVLPGDDEATLAARVLAAEHRLYPAALSAYLQGSSLVDGEVLLNIEGRRVSA